MKFEIGDLVTVKLTSPKYTHYQHRVGIIEEIMARAPYAIIVSFNYLKCSFNADELEKV